MALLSNTTSEYEYFSGNIGGLGISNFSMCGWIYIINPTSDDGIMGISHPTNGRFVGLAFVAAAQFSIGTSAGNSIFSVQPPTNTWVWVGLTSSPDVVLGTIQGYWSAHNSNIFNSQTRTNDTDAAVQATITMAFLKVFNEPTNNLRGRMAAWKVWDVAISNEELQAEKWSYKPIRYKNLYLFRPMFNKAEGGQDYSGNNRHTTMSGTLTTVDGPPVPWSQTVRKGIYRPNIADAGPGTTPVTQSFILALEWLQQLLQPRILNIESGSNQVAVAQTAVLTLENLAGVLSSKMFNVDSLQNLLLNRTLSGQATQGLLNSRILNLENLLKLIDINTPSVDSLQGLLSGKQISEANQRLLSRGNELSLENLQILLKGGILNDASHGGVVDFNKLNIDNLQRLLQDKIVNIDSLQNLQLNKMVNIVGQQGSLTTKTLVLEMLQGILTRGILAAEWSGTAQNAVSAVGVLALEILQGIVSKKIVNIDNLQNIVVGRNLNVEMLKGIRNTNVFNIENLYGLFKDGISNIESLQGVLARGILSAEWTGTTQFAVSAFGVLALEILQGIAKLNNANVENTQSLIKGSVCSIESLRNLSGDNLFSLTNLLGLSKQNVLNIESLEGILKVAILSVESGAGNIQVAMAGIVALEMLRGLSKTNNLMVENLQGLNSVHIANVDFYSVVPTAFGVMPIESLKGVKSPYTLPISVLQTLLRSNIFPIAWGDDNPIVAAAPLPTPRIWILDSRDNIWGVTQRNNVWTLSKRRGFN